MALEEFIKNATDRMIKAKYPHIQQPETMCAVITKCVTADDHYRYNLKILDKNMAVDEGFTELPDIKSRKSYPAGSVVAILLPYGKLELTVIVTEVVR